MPHILRLDHGLVLTGPMIINPDVLACRIDAYLGANPKPELSRHIFYMLANAFTQLSESGPMLPKAEF